MQPRQWHRQDGAQTLTISTSPALISRDFVHASFASPAMYWASPITPDVLETMLQTSLFFGVYVNASPENEELKQIGMARLVTDYASLAFLTDMFVVEEYQGKGLAKWLMRCVREWSDAMPAPRRVMLMAKRAPHAVRFYEEAVGAEVFDQEGGEVVFMSTKMKGVDS